MAEVKEIACYASRPTHDMQRVKRRIDIFTTFMEGWVNIPLTKRSVGMDAIIGLAPGIGDIVGLGLSVYLIIEARLAKAPRSIIKQMVHNTLVDAIFGSVPIAGDAFDFFYRANSRNRDLLHAFLEEEMSIIEHEGHVTTVDHTL